MKAKLIISMMLLLALVLASIATAAANPAWSIETVDSAGWVGKFTSIALDASGYPHISYTDCTTDDLKYAKWTGSAWSKETVDSAGFVGECTSIALDASGYPHISYSDSTNYDLKYAKWTGSAWSKETVDSAGYVGWYTSIALDASGYPHISYFDYTTDDLKYAKWTGSAWSKETVDSTEGYSTSIAIDASGYPHISYYGNSTLKYAKWTGSAWSKETVDSDVCLFTSIALDASGYPHISYFDHTNYDLKYAKWTGSAWSKETVDSAGDVGNFMSIALDASGYPHISYLDAANYDLKYAKWTGSTWSKETVDSDGGFYTSIALDASGYPHISHWDGTNSDLKYATEAGLCPELAYSQHAPPSSNVGTGTPNVLVNTLDFTATGEDILVDKINITMYGSGSSADIGDVKIYKETGGDGFDPFADLDISDSATADAWVGSVCTVTLGTGGSNVPQTIEVGDATWYIVFDIAPDATVGDTVGGKIAFGADISAKVDGETVVAQKVGADPTEVRTVIALISGPLETEHFRIHYSITGNDMVNLRDNKQLTDSPGEITWETELVPGSNGRPDFVEKVAISFEKAWKTYCDDWDYPAGHSWNSSHYNVYIVNIRGGGACRSDFLGFGLTRIEISNRLSEVPITDQAVARYLDRDGNGLDDGGLLLVCAHEYFHAIQRRMTPHQFKLADSDSGWINEGTAMWMGYKVSSEYYPASNDAMGYFDFYSELYLTNPSRTIFLTADGYPSGLYWHFLDENKGINFDGNGETIIKRFWLVLQNWDTVPPDEREITRALEENGHSNYDVDATFKLFAKANYFWEQWYDLERPMLPWIREFDMQFTDKFEREFKGATAIERYGVTYFEIVNAKEDNTIQISFNGDDNSKFFTHVYPGGNSGHEYTIPDGSSFTLPKNDGKGTVVIVGRLWAGYPAELIGDGSFKIKFVDVTHYSSTPTSTILPTQRIPITTSIDPTTEATFKLLWQGSTLNLTLLTPEDVLIDPTTTDPNITHVKNATYEYYTIQDPVPGDWTMNILAVDVPPEGENFTAIVYVATNLTLSLDTDKSRYDPGETITIEANLTNNSTPVTGASVQAEVQRPDGSENITLFDDGTHSDAQTNDGVYSNTYTATSAGGTYIIKATARGTIDGYPFVRERQRSVLVQLAPDLIVADIIFSDNAPSSGDVIIINASIQNIGGVNASHFSVEFYDGDPYVDGTYIGSEPITTNLTLGEAVNAATSWTAKSGSHIIFVRVPPLALEINESNNIANKTVYVTPIYNLSIIAAGTDKSIYAPNENVTIYCIVENADHELFSPDIVYAEIKSHTFNLSEYTTGYYIGIFNQTSQTGTYNITVYANKTGYENDTFGLCFEVVSENQAPFANFTYSPRYPVVNQSITFNASNSTDPDGYITNYKWEFGNGNITDTTAPIINHKYALAGEYTVNLTVTDNNESTDSTSQLVKVTRKVPPEITFYAPESSVNDTVCTWRTFNITVNQTVNVSWYLNNTLQHTNVSTKEASSTFHADDMGEHNVTAIASNANGTAMQTWIWNVTEESSHTFVLSAGWNMISFPVEPQDNDADTIFGPEYYYLCTWDSVAGGYVSINEIETEIGYWLLVTEDRNVTVLGTPLSEYNTSITQGWNMIGSLWTATNVPDGTETVPADQVYPHFYTWCGDHYELTQDIDPGLGYWALAYVDCELHVFPAPQAAPPLSMHIPRGESDWGVKLDVTCGAGTDIAEFGMNVDATDGFDVEFDVPEAPPPPPPYQQACFYYPENPLVKKLSTSYIPHHFVDSKELNTWPFQLDYNGEASEVTITWNATDIAAVPTNYSLLFGVDGEKIDMRSTPSYTFSATTGTYEFEIRATTGGEKPDLVITEMYETFVDDRHFNITYMVNNTGCADAGPSNTTIYIDDDPLEVPTPAIPKYERYENIVDDDPLEVPTPAIPKYECYENTVGPFECPCGEILNVTVCADNGNVINESNETNNCEVNIIECPPPRPGIEVNKTVWDKESQSWVDETTAEISEIVRFRCEMHNNGTCCPLTNLVVTDTLSDGLEYADNVTIYLHDDIIDLVEPFRVGGTYVWKFPNMVLVPCDTITIEFDAHVIKSGRDWNKQNATAEGCGKIVSDEDYAYVNVLIAEKPDLTVTEITVNYDAPGLGGRAIGLEPGVGMHTECNNISARIEEVKGVNVVSPFDVSFEIDEVQICSVRVPGLTAGSNKRVYCNGSWYPMAGDDFAIIVTVDSKHVIPETNETDNTKWNNGTVVSNGYKGNGWQGPDMNLENVQCLDQDTINLIYSVGDSYYLSGAKQWTKYTANWAANDLPVPEFTNVEEAAYIETAILYVYYTWDKDKVMPDNVDLKFNDNDIQYRRHYSDRKGFGGYDYPAGMLVYKVTDEFNAAGNNKAELTKSVATDEVSMTGMLLMVVYKHPDEPERIICIDDGFDMLYANENYAVSSEEATTYAPFTCCEPIQIEEIVNAILIAVAPNAADGDYKNRLSFNDGLWNGVWDHYEGATELGIAETNVLAHLQVRDNVANFQSHIPAGGTKGDFMEASNAFLILEKSGEPGVPGVPNADTNIEPTQ